MTSETIYDAPEPFAPAPVVRRIGAHLLDSALGLLVFYLITVPMAFASSIGLGDLYVALCQAFVIAWVVFKDAWWPGQSLGKKIARIRIVMSQTGLPATRMRCVGRQAIFAALLVIITLSTLLYSFWSGEIAQLLFTSGVLSAVAPERLITLFFPGQGSVFTEANIPHLFVLGFLLVEALLVYARSDRRRVVDLLAGTKVVDDRGPRPS